MLRQGDYHWIMEEQKRSEVQVRAASGGCVSALSACREATQALCSLLVLDLSEGSRDFLASFAVGLDLGQEAITSELSPRPACDEEQRSGWQAGRADWRLSVRRGTVA